MASNSVSEHSHEQIAQGISLMAQRHHNSQARGVLPEEVQVMAHLAKLDDYLRHDKPEFRQEFDQLLTGYLPILVEPNRQMIEAIFVQFRKVILNMFRLKGSDWIHEDPNIPLFTIGRIYIVTSKIRKGLNIQLKAINKFEYPEKEFPHCLEEFITLMGKYNRAAECHEAIKKLSKKSKFFKPYLVYSLYQTGDKDNAYHMMENYLRGAIFEKKYKIPTEKLPFVEFVLYKLTSILNLEHFMFHEDWLDKVYRTFDGYYWKAIVNYNMEYFNYATEAIIDGVYRLEEFSKHDDFYNAKTAYRLDSMLDIMDKCFEKNQMYDIEMKKYKKKRERLEKSMSKVSSEQRYMRYLILALSVKLSQLVINRRPSQYLHPELFMHVFDAYSKNEMFDQAIIEHQNFKNAMKNVKIETKQDALSCMVLQMSGLDEVDSVLRYGMKYFPEANDIRFAKNAEKRKMVDKESQKRLLEEAYLEQARANFDVHNYPKTVYYLERFLSKKSKNFLTTQENAHILLMLGESYIFLKDWKQSLFYSNIMCKYDHICNQNELDAAFVKKAYCHYQLNSFKKAMESLEQAHFLDKVRPTSFLIEMLVVYKENPNEIEKSCLKFMRRFKSMRKMKSYLASVIITTDIFLSEHWQDIMKMLMTTIRKQNMKKSVGFESFRSSNLLNLHFARNRYMTN